MGMASHCRVLLLGVFAGCASAACTQQPKQDFSVVDLYGGDAAYADLQDEYAAIKAEVRRVAQAVDDAPADESMEADDSGEAGIGPEAWVVFDCGFTEGIDSSLGEPILPASTLDLLVAAKGSVALEGAAINAGYPPSVWRPSLEEYERDALVQVLRDRYAERHGKSGVGMGGSAVPYPDWIVDDMTAYREQHAPGLHELIAQEGCGAGDFMVRIEAEGASLVRLVPEFFARLCEARPSVGLARCRYWVTVAPDDPLSVAGVYRYAASWPDGKSTTGRVDFDAIGDANAETDDVPVFRIRR